MSQAKKTPKKPARLTARSADRHHLYQVSVQAPEDDARLLAWLYRRRTGRSARSLREDFCGTAILAATWVKSEATRVATGIDLDPRVLEWAHRHNRAPLLEAGERLTLLEEDVTVPTRERFDVIAAFNYSYSVFKTRAALRAYFAGARRSLAPGGILVLDAWGGWEAQQPMRDRRRIGGFTYVWHRTKYDPISSELLAHIHFEFPDRTKIERAFTYDWRLWQLAELRELMVEAGFAEPDVLWEHEDEKGEGTGEFRKVKRAKNDPIWNAYLVAQRAPPAKRAAPARRR